MNTVTTFKSVEERLEQARREYDVDVFAFFVGNDPFCPAYLSCLTAPGANYPEATSHYLLKPIVKTWGEPIDNMRGGLFKFQRNALDLSFRNGNSPEVEELLKKDSDKNKIFGDFVTREDVVSRAIFLSLDPENNEAKALLTANYRKQMDEQQWNKNHKAGLLQLFADLVDNLVATEKRLDDAYFSLYPKLARFVAIIDPTQSSPAHDSRGVAKNKLEHILRTAIDAMPSYMFSQIPRDWCATIHLYDHNRKTLWYAAAVGSSPEPLRREHRIDLGEGVISWVALRRQAILINDLDKSDFNRIHLPYYRFDVRSQLAVPMMEEDGRLRGVLSLESTVPNAFEWQSVGLLTAAATLATFPARNLTHAPEEVSPLHKEVIAELRWADEQEAKGAFDAYAGRYLGIVNRALQAVGGDPTKVIAEAATKTGVALERVALFHVECAE